ncbi:MAG TPA: hypothetical protein VFA48_12060 [Gammaproteobacteria bacterium]|nr:hypothetical protein [Gammaproteobacteria bacterium]
MSSVPFNDAQTRHIVATLRHVDALLTHAMQAGSAGIGTPEGMLQAIPAETQTALSEMRKELHSALRIWAPGESAQPDQARWALQTALRLALISIGELDARHLGHYGRVDPAGLDQLAETSERLEKALENIRMTLEQN